MHSLSLTVLISTTHSGSVCFRSRSTHHQSRAMITGIQFLQNAAEINIAAVVGHKDADHVQRTRQFPFVLRVSAPFWK